MDLLCLDTEDGDANHDIPVATNEDDLLRLEISDGEGEDELLGDEFDGFDD